MITNQPQMYEANSHSRVIFKNYNDDSTRDFLNSYRYEPSKHKQYKKWKPDISPEERFKKKRDREEEYLQNFHPDDRPVLLVQKKHEYKGVENPNVFVDPTQREAYYKVSQNTETLDDITDEIKSLERFIKRNTVVHKPKAIPEEENLSSVYKVEGKEFLPEGFIELDPLLMRDEYEFEGDVDKKQFDEEQRRLKMLRRKQYEQRNQNKIRDVTIFVMDEQKNKALMFLDKWVRQHKRKMNEAEIEYVADHLKVPSQKMSTLQDLYFKKQEIIRNRKFNDPSLQGTGPAHLRDLPNNIKGQFQKNKFDNVDSRYLLQNDPYVPTFLNKYNKRPISKQQTPKDISRSPSNNNSRLMDTKELDKALNDTLNDKNARLQDSYEDLHKDVEKQQQNKQSKQSIPDYEKFIEEKKSYGSIDEKSGNFDTLQDPFEKILNNEKNLKKEKKESKNKIQNEQQKVENFQKKRPSFENDLQRYFDNEIDSILGKINNDDQPEKEEPKQRRQTRKKSIIEVKEELQKIENPDDELKQYPHDIHQIQILKLPKSFTVYYHIQDGGLETTHKLKPIAIGNEYFYQTIIQKTDPNKNTKAVLTTRNDQGEILSTCDIPPSYIGKNYKNQINDIVPEFRGDQGKEVVVKNNKGQIVHTQILRPRIDQLDQNNLRPQLKNENFKKSHVIDQESIITHNLNPVVFNGKQYRQVVEQLEIKQKNLTQVNVLTYDENNEILANKRTKPFFISENYYSMIDTEELENGQKKFSLLTKNKKGELMADYELDIQDVDFKEKYLNNQVNEQDGDVEIYNLNPVIVGDRILRQEIHLKQDEDKAKVKTFDDFDTQINQDLIDKKLVTAQDYSELCDKEDKLMLKTKNKKGETISQFELPDEYNQIQKTQKFDEITEVIDDEGFRRASIAVKTSPQQQFRSYQLRPTLIGNQFYQQTINELINVEEPMLNEAVLITKDEVGNVLNVQDLRADRIAQDYYNQIVDESIDNQGKRRATILTLNNQNELVGRYEVSQSLAQKFGDEMCDKIIEECINENQNNKDDIDLVKIDQNDDKEIEVQQLHLNDDQVNQLGDISNQEYFEKLLDLFGVRNPRRSFQKSEIDQSLVRPKAHTYARIPFNYNEKPKLSEMNKNLIDQYMQEVNEIHENYQSQKNPIEDTEKFIQKNIIEEEKPTRRKSSVQKQVQEEQPKRKQTNIKKEIQEEKPKRKQTTKADEKPQPNEIMEKAQKIASERIRSKTKTNKKKKNTMTFEDMEKKLKEMERKKEISPTQQTRDKQPSVIEKEFKPSKISQLYEHQQEEQQIKSDDDNLQQNHTAKKNTLDNIPYDKSESQKSSEKNIQEKEQKSDSDQQDSDKDDQQSLKDLQEQAEEIIEDKIEQILEQDDLDQDEPQPQQSDKQILPEPQPQQSKKSLHENRQSKQSLRQSKKDLDENRQSKKEIEEDKPKSKKTIVKSKKDTKKPKKKSVKKVTAKRNSIDPNMGGEDKRESSLQKPRKSSVKKKEGSQKRKSSNSQNKRKSSNSQNKRKSVTKKEQPKGKHTNLMEDKEQLKSYFDDYIKNNQMEDEELKKRLSNIMEEPDRRDSNILKKIQKKKGQKKQEMLDEFAQFCKELEKDNKYKRSVFFATLFYYFTDLKRRNKLINKQIILMLMNFQLISFSMSLFLFIIISFFLSCLYMQCFNFIFELYLLLLILYQVSFFSSQNWFQFLLTLLT